MADYPSVGLKIDLNEIVQGIGLLRQMKQSYLDLGEAASSASKTASASGATRKAASDQGADAQVKAAQRAAKAEQQAISDTLRAARAMMSQRNAIAQQQANQELGYERAAQKASADTLAFKLRMYRQAAAEAQSSSAAEAKAQASAAADATRVFDAVAKAKMSQYAEVQNQAKAASAAETKAAQQSAAEATRVFEAYAKAKMSSYAATQAEAKASSAAEAKAQADAAAQATRQFEAYAKLKMGQYQDIQKEAKASADAEAKAQIKAAADASRAFEAYAKAKMASYKASLPKGADLDYQAPQVSALGTLFAALGERGKALTGIFGGLRNALGDIRSAFFDARTAVGLFLGAMVLKPIADAADQMKALEARTAFYAEKASDVPYTFQAIYQAAQQARVPLEGIATLYTRLAPLADRLGKSQSQILSVASTISKSFTIGGASPEEARSSSQQLSQAFGSNRFGGDELRSVAENAPIYLGLIAKQFTSVLNPAVQMSTGEFIKWAQKGNVGAKELFDATEKIAPVIDKMFANFPTTIGQSITLVSNAFTHLVGEVDASTGASEQIAKLIAQFADFLGSADTIKTVSDAVNGLGTALGVLGGIVSAVGQALPTIIAAFTAMAAAKVLPAIIEDLGIRFLYLQSSTIKATGSFTALNVAKMGATNAAKSLLGALGGLADMFGGPLGIGAIAAVAYFNALKVAQDDAGSASKRLADNQDTAVSAYQHAIAYSDTYGLSTATLSSHLNDLLGATTTAATATDGIAGKHDKARDAALLRAKAEALVTSKMLEQASVEARQDALKTQEAITGKQVSVLGIKTPFFTPGLQAQRALDVAGHVSEQDDPAYQAYLKSTYDDPIKAAGAASRQGLALSSQLHTDSLKALDVGAVTLPDVKPPGSGDPDAAKKEAASAINAIAKLRASIAGLRAEAASVSADPLSVMAAQISKAADEEGAKYTAGKNAGIKAEASLLAGMKEELTIRLGLLRASAEETRQNQLELATQALLNKGFVDGEKAIQAYYSAGTESFNNYQDALDAQTDATEKAQEAVITLKKAQQYGVSSLDDIANAYDRATHSGYDAAMQVQNSAKASVASAIAVAQQGASMEKTTRQVQNLTAAEKARYDQQVADSRLVSSVDLGTTGRESDDRARVIQANILNQAKAAGIKMTDDEALAQARVTAEIENQIAKTAQLKISIQDSIKQAFIDTGKLDFSSLKKSLTAKLREAIYDALLAKPIDIVVNASVNVLTQALQQFMGNSLSSFMSGQGGIPGGSAFKGAANVVSNIFGGGGDGSGAGYSGAALTDTFARLSSKSLSESFMDVGSSASGAVTKEVVGPLADATKGVSSAFSSAISGLGSLLGQGAAGYGEGTAFGSLIGTRQSTAAGIGGALGGIAGSFLPIPGGQIIGSFLGNTLGSLLGGKPSNNATVAQLDASGNVLAYQGNKSTDATKATAQSAAQAVSQGEQALRAAGLTLTQTVSSIDIGTRDTTHIILSSGQKIESAVGDASAAATAALKAVVAGAQTGDSTLQALINQMSNAGDSINDVVTAIQNYATAQTFVKGVGNAILQFTDPKAAAVQTLQDQQKTRRDQLNQYASAGLISPQQLTDTINQLNQLDSLELADTLKQFADGVNDATHSLQDFKDAQTKISDYLGSLMTGSLSPLSPQAQLGLSGNDFFSNLNKANGGDYNALSGITDKADSYLQAAQQFYGSSETYNSIFDTVESALSALSDKDFQDPTVSAIDDSKDAIVGAVQQSAADNAAQLAALGEAIIASNVAVMQQLTASVQASIDYNASMSGRLVA